MDPTEYEHLEELQEKAREGGDLLTVAVIAGVFDQAKKLFKAVKALKEIRGVPCPATPDNVFKLCDRPDCPRCIARRVLNEIGHPWPT